MNKEHGIFINSHDFRTDKEIMDKLSGNPESVIQMTPLTTEDRTFKDWGTIFTRRQEERKDVFNVPEHISISIPTDEPILLVPWGDIHAGGQEVDYDRFTREVEMVAETKGVFAMTLGDITDGFFWGGKAQDSAIGSLGEQNAYMRSVMTVLANRNKLLCSWGGDHCMWSADRGETIYRQFGESYKAHFLYGVSYVSLTVGEQLYKISGAHRHNGFSIFNPTQPELRIYRDDAEGSDIVIGAHTHRKGTAVVPSKRFGGNAENVYYVAIGAYKSTDDYAQKKGFHRLAEKEMGAQSILLYPKRRLISVFDDVASGIFQLKLVKGEINA